MSDVQRIEQEVGASQLPLTALPESPSQDDDRLLNNVAANPVHTFRLARRTTLELDRIVSLVAKDTEKGKCFRYPG